MENGLVDYQTIQKDPHSLNRLVRMIAEFDVDVSPVVARKAFYTNVYNILVIKQIMENYPTKGPMYIPGFFDTQTYSVAGTEMTLDFLEKKVLFQEFPDARLHFVLVCAAIGCPPIAEYAYTPDSLESQLEQKTGEVLNINGYVRMYNYQYNWSLNDSENSFRY